MLDIHTLSIVAVISALAFFIVTFTVSRLLPQEHSLRDWVAAAALLAAGLLLLGLRGIIPDFISIVIANSLTVLGIGFLYVGTRNLLGAGSARHWHWIGAGAMFIACIVFTYISPNLPARIIAFSVTTVPFYAACGWLFWRHGETQLRVLDRFTALLCISGAFMLLARAIAAPSANVSPDYLTTRSWLIALPYFYMILSNAWMGIMLTLTISARLQRKLVEERDRADKANGELQVLNRKLEALSTTDELTGIANRRRFDEVLAIEWSRAARSKQSLALALLDIDWFKKYNDHYGHQAGDECLRSVTRAFNYSFCRTGDLVARYGGEEFVFIAPATDGENALSMAKKICATLQALALPHEVSGFGCVTASIGVAAIVPGEADTPDMLVNAADKALYRAKELGRNRAILA